MAPLGEYGGQSGESCDAIHGAKAGMILPETQQVPELSTQSRWINSWLARVPMERQSFRSMESVMLLTEPSRKAA